MQQSRSKGSVNKSSAINSPVILNTNKYCFLKPIPHPHRVVTQLKVKPKAPCLSCRIHLSNKTFKSCIFLSFTIMHSFHAEALHQLVEFDAKREEKKPLTPPLCPIMPLDASPTPERLFLMPSLCGLRSNCGEGSATQRQRVFTFLWGTLLIFGLGIAQHKQHRQSEQPSE